MSDAHAPLETLPRSLKILLGAALLALAAFPFVGTDYYLQMVSPRLTSKLMLRKM